MPSVFNYAIQIQTWTVLNKILFLSQIISYKLIFFLCIQTGQSKS